jgi:hypothetical protein
VRCQDPDTLGEMPRDETLGEMPRERLLVRCQESDLGEMPGGRNPW